MKYDVENCILTLDDFSQCNQEYIKSWVDENISDILSNDNAIYRDYITGKLEVTITVVYRDYIVGIYYLSNDMLYAKSEEWVSAHISEVEEPEEQEREEQEAPEEFEKEEPETDDLIHIGLTSSEWFSIKHTLEKGNGILVYMHSFITDKDDNENARSSLDTSRKLIDLIERTVFTSSELPF